MAKAKKNTAAVETNVEKEETMMNNTNTTAVTYTEAELDAMLMSKIEAMEAAASIIKESGDSNAASIMDNAKPGEHIQAALASLGVVMDKGKGKIKEAATAVWTNLKAAWMWGKTTAPKVLAWMQDKMSMLWKKAKALVVGLAVFSWKAAPVVVNHVAALGSELAGLFKTEVIDRVAMA